LNGLTELLGSLIVDYINRDFEEEEVKVAYIGPSIRVFVEESYVELVRGSEYTLPRWVAQVLEEKGYAKPSGELLDEVTVTRLYFNESRSKGQLKFEKLNGYFYSRVKHQLTSMLKSCKKIEDFGKAQQVFQTISNLATSTKNLYRVRLSKILSLIGVDVGPEVLSCLSEEEKYLYTVLKGVLEFFNTRVFEVEKHG